MVGIILSRLRPRPLLVKFTSVNIVNTILKGKFYVISPGDTAVSIRRDLTLEERKCESQLLKERYRLVAEVGVDRSLIRLRRRKLFIGDRLHGTADSSGFHCSPTVGDVAPSLANDPLNSSLVTDVPVISLDQSSPSVTGTAPSGTSQVTPSLVTTD